MNTDSLFEYLVPALFFVFYIIAKILEARNKKAAPRETSEGAEPSTIDEVRREIQKKILERQKQGSPQQHESRPEEAWKHEAKMKTRAETAQVELTQQGKPFQEDYALRLKKEKQRLETSRKEAQKIRENLNKRGSIAKPKPKVQHTHISVQESLSNPAQARNAYIYHEIFGTPVALRKREGMLPCWKL